ncbi:hypothetical protein GGR55DRAFT_195606 [Xylaria sp. FL0064]|nr:hypothetical protein GGR55DRAFT_195606 [Xylaria sp. FL0064]
MTRKPRAKSGRFLIPARDSRHRIACLALYHALLRLAPQIPLPDELASGWGPGKNPIAIHIQRAFRRNVADTSPRIVYPALSAGYRMLSVLQDAAASPSSQHHASIVAFLHPRLAERQRSLANRPPPPPSYNPKSDRPHPDTLPLLVKVSPPPSPSNPHPTPVYTTPHRPRPQSELGGTGRRKIPRLDLASDIPFLRFTKPQPAVLSRVLRQKVEKRTWRAQAMTSMQAEGLPEARLEDEWESQMARLMIAEKSVKRDNRSSGDLIHKGWQDEHDVGIGNRRDERSHAYTLERHGVRALADLLTRERVKEVAIADAMRQLIIKEKALAAQEEAQRHAERRANWEAKMLELHGEGWQDLFPNLKESEEQPVEQPVQQRKRAHRRTN